MTKLLHLYILTITLLVAHQIDSAYWHEWNLFGIPGGIQVFVLLNLPLVGSFCSGSMGREARCRSRLGAPARDPETWEGSMS